MSIDIKILNCPLSCQSCYENRIRQAQGRNQKYDIKAILKTIDEEVARIPGEQRKNCMTIHGGEPLAFKFKDLEVLLKKIYGYYKYTSIQSNLILLKKKHIGLFQKYATHIGISLDGNTPELNQGRGGDLELIICNLRRLKEANLKLSIITILRKYNASYRKIGQLLNFLDWLKDEFGIVDVRLNPGIVFEDRFRAEEELENEELGDAFICMADACFADPGLMWQPFRDIVDLMLGYSDATCNFAKCDAWHTTAEIPVMADGSLGNCLKPAGATDGIAVLRADKYSDERYEILPQIPQKHGGCKDCRFWLICQGGCPGSGIDNDWRNRTRFCEAWQALFNHIEKRIKGLIPNIYTVPEIDYKDPRISQINLGVGGSSWRKNRQKNVQESIESTKNEQGKRVNGHGDRPHGDEHGDHTDRALLRK